MTKPAHFFFLLAGEKLSETFDNYCMRSRSDSFGRVFHDLTDFEEEMDTTKEGHKDFDSCEDEAKVALQESELPFAIVFQGSKIYGYISKEKTATFEVI